MAIDTKHPSYAERIADWNKLRDCAEGERRVKQARTAYLPATPGMEFDGMQQGKPGRKSYDAYLARAVYPELLSDAVEAMVGILHREPADIQLPARMEDMRLNSTVSGESLETLLRKINEAQLTLGRYGLLLDVPDGQGPDAIPFIAGYAPEAILNWGTVQRDFAKEEVQFVVLDESQYQYNTSLEWELKQKYRILVMAGEDSPLQEGEGVVGGFYHAAVVNQGGSLLGAPYIMPQIGGTGLEEIPFVFVNTCDLVPQPDKPPLLSLATVTLTIYRGEADYRQSLFMQGQDTLVLIGGLVEKDATDPNGGKGHRIGAGAFLEVPMGGDAKFIGVSENGLKEQREALQNDRRYAAELGAKLLDGGGATSGKESGEALRIRVAARTANLTSIAMVGAEALQDILRKAAVWMGLNPEEVIVTPNLDFVDDPMTGKDLLAFMQAKAMGAPLSKESIHRMLRKRDLTELDYQEELEQIEEEEPDDLPARRGEPGQAVDDEDADE